MSKYLIIASNYEAMESFTLNLTFEEWETALKAIQKALGNPEGLVQKMTCILDDGESIFAYEDLYRKQ